MLSRSRIHDLTIHGVLTKGVNAIELELIGIHIHLLIMYKIFQEHWTTLFHWIFHVHVVYMHNFIIIIIIIFFTFCAKSFWSAFELGPNIWLICRGGIEELEVEILFCWAIGI